MKVGELIYCVGKKLEWNLVSCGEDSERMDDACYRQQNEFLQETLKQDGTNECWSSFINAAREEQTDYILMVTGKRLNWQ